MLKYQVPLATVLATLFVVPLSNVQEELTQLESTHAAISRSIDIVKSIQQELEREPDQGVALILASTETPRLEQREQDERLAELRKEVSLLQMELDALDHPGSRTRPAVPQTDVTTRSDSSGETMITGLDDALRRSLEGRPRGGARSTPTQPIRGGRNDRGGHRTAQATPTIPKEPSPEFEGYSADPLSEARACYHVGLYEKALEVLSDREDSAANYWKARCLERLERLDEAMALMSSVVAAEGDSYQGRRASSDLEFFQWKKEFLEKLPQGMRARRDG